MAVKPKRSEPLGVTTPKELKMLLREEAEKDRRTLSSLVTKILSDWLEQKKKAERTGTK